MPNNENVSFFVVPEKDSTQGRRLLARANYWREAYRKRTTNHNILSEKQKKEILSVFGGYQDLIDVDTIFHSFYFEKTGVFDSRIFPVDLYYCFIDPYFNNWETAPVMDNKCLYPRLFKDTKQPEIYFCRINNIWTDVNARLLTREEMNSIINNTGELVIKQAVSSEGGKNVFFVSGRDKLNQFWNACETIKKDIVVQGAIKQHESINAVNATSVNTIRVLSLLTQEQVKICSVILRMGIEGKRVDNISQGGIACGVDSCGRLKKVAYNYKGEVFNEHPTSKIKFDSVTIPNFDRVCNLVKMTHPSIPDYRLVSWDIAVDQNGEPLLLEANLCYGELNLHQLNNGAVFGDDTEKVLAEVFGSKKYAGGLSSILKRKVGLF